MVGAADHTAVVAVETLLVVVLPMLAAGNFLVGDQVEGLSGAEVASHQAVTSSFVKFVGSIITQLGIVGTALTLIMQALPSAPPRKHIMQLNLLLPMETGF